MRLLIVDDERLTREGLRDAINWKNLGIFEIREAVDGLGALSIMNTFKPDILLTDVRMPRMDGIKLATELRRINPGCKVIFISGYADKEYLKAAISLKAVQYVEKPIDAEELEDAVKQAIQERMDDQLINENEAFARANSSLVRQQATLNLIGESIDEHQLRKQLDWTGFNLPSPVVGATVLVKIVDPIADNDQAMTIMTTAAHRFACPFLLAPKDSMHYVLHLIPRAAFHLDKPSLRTMCQELASALSTQFPRFAVAAGDIVNDIHSFKQSYINAVVRIQEAFYLPPCAVVTDNTPLRNFSEEQKRLFMDNLKAALKLEQFDEIDSHVQHLTDTIRKCPMELVNATKDLYRRIAIELEAFAESRGIRLFTLQNGDSPLEFILGCHFIDDVLAAVKSKLRQLQEEVTERSKNTTASRVMRYIHEHYARESLSVGDLSEYMQMTNSHLIAVFRKSTGKTVKQYLMEYRVEKAKQLLMEDWMKMSVVASRMGFKDGEYFAKVFRKHAGMTPSEYRNRYRP
ncbi:response regulator [Paenibacillus sp. LHD-117]|uniref:response regulator transcription factor n=1 Tax=Paenibacillus sp. LHD-117 TaxID=3071412 RepID=UPI0027DF371D|nr:response regulator [Paenibacillus sp. LHD-117]MDQ6422979.1 response regulator [Paenibacillus sp. LHD-117]